MTEDFRHKSGLAKAYDRTALRPTYTDLVFTEGQIIQGADLNEIQSRLKNRGQRVAETLLRDGDRISGADIIFDSGTGNATLTAGKIYLQGDVRDVATASLTGIPLTGSVSVGIRMVTSVVTMDDDAALGGLEPGTDAEGEPGAAREVETVSWGFEGDGNPGALFAVYLIKDATVIDQTPPPRTTGVEAQIAIYDSGAHGNYVVSGCSVTAIGVVSGQQVFSIGAGEANILGWKRTRFNDYRWTRAEDPDTQVVTAEPHTFADGGTGTVKIPVNHPPISAVTAVVIEKIITQTITHGAITGSLDALPKSSVTQIISVSQGATTYTATADYKQTGDKVDWTPAGLEPAPGSNYSVTYRYVEAVGSSTDGTTATGYLVDATSITVAGGVTGGQVSFTYSWKVPRVDLLCFDQAGTVAYVKGVSSPTSPLAPPVPTELLPLAVITQSWTGLPSVAQSGVRSITFADEKRWFDLVDQLQDLVALNRLQMSISSIEPVAKKGIFVDPFLDDRYRDDGTVQTAAVFDGQMSLAIDATPTRMVMSGPVLLDRLADEVIVDQSLGSVCMLINPYQSFLPTPGSLALDPSDDYWTVFSTAYLSDVTKRVTGSKKSTVTTDKSISTTDTTIELLRPISINFTIRSWAPNEHLTALLFDGVDVTPAGPLMADSHGVITGSFTIPNLVKAGTKVVHAEGSADSVAEAIFVGQGTLETNIRQKITTITVVPAIPVVTTDPGSSSRGGMTTVSEGGHLDPLAQTFSLTEGRYVTGVNLKFCAAGNRNKPVIIDLRTVQNGVPTNDIYAQAVVDMNTVVLGAWTSCLLKAPVWLPANQTFAWVIKTDDAAHSVLCGKLGDADILTGKRIAGQPYTVGVLLSSSNAETWTAHQDMDLTFQILAAVFSPTTKTFNFGTFTVANLTDMMVMANAITPTVDGNIWFEVERQNGTIIKLSPFQAFQFAEFVSEPLKFRAMLTGTRTVSPILYPGVTWLWGTIRSTGSYVTDEFVVASPPGTVTNYIKCYLPSGSGITSIKVSGDGGATYTNMPYVSQAVLDLGVVEQKYEVTGWNSPKAKLQILFYGTPAARPWFTDERCLAK